MVQRIKNREKRKSEMPNKIVIQTHIPSIEYGNEVSYTPLPPTSTNYLYDDVKIFKHLMYIYF